jgi:dUTP pyrophosphatase
MPRILTCEYCGKEFKRQCSKRVDKFYTCSRKCRGMLERRRIEVPCKVCGKLVSYKKSKYIETKNHTCSPGCLSKIRRIKFSGNNNPLWKEKNEVNKLEKFMRLKANAYKSRAKKKQIDFDLTYEFLVDLYNKQNKKCYYSGLELSLDNTHGYNIISLDRVDSTKGYTKDNVVFCLNCINLFKNQYEMSDIEKVFRAIIMKNDYMINTNVKRLYPDAKLPYQNSTNDAGHDLYVHKVEDLGDYVKVYSGIALEPEVGKYYQLAPRSSTYKKGLSLANNLGIIDSNYRGEIIGIFNKTNLFEKLPEIGDRIMQIIPAQQYWVTFKEVDNLEETTRGSGSFGSTGVA